MKLWGGASCVTVGGFIVYNTSSGTVWGRVIYKWGIQVVELFGGGGTVINYNDNDVEN